MTAEMSTSVPSTDAEVLANDASVDGSASSAVYTSCEKRLSSRPSGVVS